VRTTKLGASAAMLHTLCVGMPKPSSSASCASVRLHTLRGAPPARQQQASERGAAHHAAALLRVRLPLALRHAPHDAVNPGPVPVLASEQAAEVFRGAGRASVRGLGLHLHCSSRLRLAPPPPAKARRVACRHVARRPIVAVLHAWLSQAGARAAAHRCRPYDADGLCRALCRAPCGQSARCKPSPLHRKPPTPAAAMVVNLWQCVRAAVLQIVRSPPMAKHQPTSDAPEEDTLHVRFPKHQEHGTDHSACASAEAKLSSFATRAHAHSTKLAGLLRMEERHGTQREPPRQEAPPAHFIAKTAVPACTVVAMAVGCFRRAGVQDTVLCKGNALELLGSMEHGDLESLHEQGAGGLVSALGVLPAEEATDVRSACTCPFALCAAPARLVSCGGAERCLHPREAPRLSIRNSRVAGACRRAARTCSCCCARTRSTTSTSTTTCTGAAVAGRNRSDLERPLAGLLRSAGHFKRLKAACRRFVLLRRHLDLLPGPRARAHLFTQPAACLCQRQPGGS